MRSESESEGGSGSGRLERGGPSSVHEHHHHHQLQVSSTTTNPDDHPHPDPDHLQQRLIQVLQHSHPLPSRKKLMISSSKHPTIVILLLFLSFFLLFNSILFLHTSISSLIFQSLHSIQNQTSFHPELIQRSIHLKPTLNSISISQPHHDPSRFDPHRSIDYPTSIQLNLSISFDLNSFLQSTLHPPPSPPSPPPPTSDWKSHLIRWFILRSPNSIINLVNSTILLHPIYPHHPTNSSRSLPQPIPILSIQFIHPFSLPLSYPSHPSHPDLIPTTSTQLNFITRFLSPDHIIHLLHYSAHHRLTRLALTIDHLDLRLDGSRFTPWISRLVQSYSRFTLSNLQSPLDFSLPDDLSSILKDPSASIQITNYSFHPITTKPESHSSLLGIRATGSIPNPLLAIQNYSDRVDFNLEFPWRFPLLINYLQVPDNRSTRDSGPSTQRVEPLATGSTSPLRLNAKDDLLSIDIDGILLDSLAHQNHSGPLTPFLNRFLKDQPNDLLIRYDSHQIQRLERLDGPPRVEAIDEEEEIPAYDDPGIGYEDQSQVDRSTILTQDLNDHQLILGHSSLPSTRPSSLLPTTNRPKFIEGLLKHLDLRVRFPGSHQPQLIKSIEIREMKIDLSIRFKILCSGEINGILDLPPQLDTLSSSINITHILPDVILLDGALPNRREDRSSRRPRSRARRVILSDDDEPRMDYPSNAFGRLRPSDWIDSKLIVEDPGGNPRIRLKARFDRVELEVLEGRSKVFRSFVAKYLLHHKRRSLDEDPHEGVLLSILGSVDGLGSLVGRLPILIDSLDLSGSFYV